MQDNKSIAKKFLAALGKGDVETLTGLLAPDMQAICTGTSVLSGTRAGAEIAGAAGMLSAITKNGIDFQVLTMTAEEDRVSVEVQGVSTLVNGVAYNNQYHFLFFIRDGKIYKLKEYIDTKLADETLAPLMMQLMQQQQ